MFPLLTECKYMHVSCKKDWGKQNLQKVSSKLCWVFSFSHVSTGPKTPSYLLTYSPVSVNFSCLPWRLRIFRQRVSAPGELCCFMAWQGMSTSELVVGCVLGQCGKGRGYLPVSQLLALWLGQCGKGKVQQNVKHLCQKDQCMVEIERKVEKQNHQWFK